MDCTMSCVVLLLLLLIKCSQADIQISGSAVLVRRVSRLVCQSNVNLSRYPGRMVAYHQWNQVYNAKTNRVIANLPAIEALNTQLTIQFEKFDNDTDIYSSFNVYNASNGNQRVFNFTIHCSGVEAWINLLDDGFYEYQIDKILNYDVTTQASFSCQAYSHLSDNIQVGWINTVTNKIFIYNLIKTELTLTAAHNGSMLCCVYYTVNDDKNGWKNIRRFVKDKTLLIHQEKVPSIVESSGTTTESYCKNTDVTKLISDTTCVYSPNTDGRNSNTTNENGKKSMTTNEAGNNFNPTNVPSKDSNAANVAGKDSYATNVPGKNSDALNEPGKDSDATNEPGKDSTNVPGKVSNATNVPSKNSDASNVPDKDSNATNVPGKYSNATNVPGKNSDALNEPDKDSDATNEPGKDSTNVPGKVSNATNVPGKNSDASNMPDKDSNATNVPGKYSNATNVPGKDSNATKEPGKDSNATKEPGKDSSATTEPGKKSNVTNETDKNLNTSDKTDSSDHDAATDSNFIIIIISSISASVLVLAVVIYVVNKRCRRNTNRRERPQMPLPQIPIQRSPDELDPNSPFYLNLLFRKECQQEIQAREEPQYEEVMYH